ncbi:MAG TPA: alpha/beta fold hydrolase [Verrucomicrobiae bacterium]|nr:alpha/beta fold hydrolase [Verrucomicrobiae bacterium]
MIHRFASIVIALFVIGCQTHAARPNIGPWNLADLEHPPQFSWGTKTGAVQQIYYQGEPFQQKPTHVFGYVGRPKKGQGPFPGIVLVHGGGGKAFKEWAEHWADRGYVALAMDLSGHGPDGRLPDGGPDQSDETNLRNFAPNDTTNMWTYHAVANVIRGHSLLASLPEVDPSRVSITGISWGGYLTCIVAGLDHRFKGAVPVYGCGFLGDNSVWKDGSLARMTPDARALWLKTFDPSQYLANTQCPILFLNGTHDFAYPLDSYQKSYRLVRPELRHVSIIMRLPHGHIWTFPEVDEFIDRALAKKRFPEIVSLHERKQTVRAKSTEPLENATLMYTSDTGPWQKREWTTLPAKLSGKSIEAKLPHTTPITYLITGQTKDGLRVSSEYFEVR